MRILSMAAVQAKETGIAPASAVEPEAPVVVEADELGHTSFVATDATIAALNVDGTAHYANTDDTGMEVYSNLPGLQGAINRNGAFGFSPRDATLEKGVLKLYEDGALVMEVTLTGLNAVVSTPITADAATVEAYVEYGKAMSADSRDRYIAMLNAVQAGLGDVVKAALEAVSPIK